MCVFTFLSNVICPQLRASLQMPFHFNLPVQNIKSIKHHLGFSDVTRLPIREIILQTDRNRCINAKALYNPHATMGNT